MTKAEAYKEMDKLQDRVYSWDRAEMRKRFDATGNGRTPYQRAVQRRIHDLHWFWRYNDHEPIARTEWETTCPARDVTEAVEDYFKNNYDGGNDKETWQRKMTEAGGKLPGFNGEYPDFERFKDATPRDMEG